MENTPISPELEKLLSESKPLSEITDANSHCPDAFGSSLMWWCPECRQDVEPDMVTYEETHDARYGGCGGDVLCIKKKNGEMNHE